MPSGRLARLQGTLPADSGRLTRLSAEVPVVAERGRLTQLRATVPDVVHRGNLTRLRATVPTPYTVSLPTVPAAEPGVPFEVVATITGGTPTTYAWSAVGGDVIPNGAKAKVIPDPTWNGDPVVVSLTVSGGGPASASASRTVQVFKHLEWYARGGMWVPVLTELLQQ